MDVNIYRAPNPAVSAILLSQGVRDLAGDKANLARDIYQSIVAKRSAALARSARAYTEIGGTPYNDRWIGVLSVGGGAVDYALPHDFGIDTEDNRGDPAFVESEGAQDLNQVLEYLGAM